MFDIYQAFFCRQLFGTRPPWINKLCCACLFQDTFLHNVNLNSINVLQPEECDFS